MFTGWLLGNLILGALIGLVVIAVMGSSGLVKVPVLSSQLFKQPTIVDPDSSSFASAQEKLSTINSLSPGQELSELTLSEEELNAVLADSFAKNQTELVNPSLDIGENRFTFNALLAETGAPVTIEGEFDASSGILRFAFLKSKFGKVSVPSPIASSILSDSLNKVGLSLDGTTIPARKVRVSEGQLILEGVTNPTE